MRELQVKAAQRVELAFRPKTRRCYELLFRNFIGFCLCSNIVVQFISLQEVMAYLEFLVQNNVSAHMLANNISALKANFVKFGLEFKVWDHPG